MSDWYGELYDEDARWEGSPPERRFGFTPTCPIRAAATLCRLEDRPVSWLHPKPVYKPSYVRMT